MIQKPTDMLDESMVVDDTGERADSAVSFEEKMLKRVNNDFKAAQMYMDNFHKACVEAYGWYHNAASYQDLKAKNLFPTTFYQEQIDTFVAVVMDKLFYKDRPCTVVPLEQTDKEDAEVKQAMLTWQDYKDRLYTKAETLVRDAAMYRVAIAQVDYIKKTKRQVVGYEEPVMVLNPTTGIEEPIVDPVTNKPLSVSRTRVADIPVYMGPTVKRIDPTDWFPVEEKETVGDEHPQMIRSRCTLKYFHDRPYFFNQDKLKDLKPGTSASGSGYSAPADETEYKRAKQIVHGLNPTQSTRKPHHTYIEWHGRVDKLELYTYLISMGKDLRLQDDDGNPTILPGEDCQAICGVVEGQVVVRLEDTPFEFDTANVIVGVIQVDEDQLIGTSITDKIQAVQQGGDTLMGIAISNFKQLVNAGHVINKNALISGSSMVVNEPGFVLLTNGDVNAVHKRVEQQRVSPDIYQYIDWLRQMGMDASGITKILGGKGEPGAETLGEAEIVAGQAQLRITSYLKTLEESLIQPLYEMRNQINMQFLDQEYVYGIVGEGAIQWRKATPGQVRANVDFICESSTRETNRHLITQQILQLLKIVPIAQNLGIPTRIDKLLQNLVEQGWSWTSERSEDIWPSLKLDKQQGGQIDQMLIETMIGEMNMRRIMAMMGPMMGAAKPPSGGPSKQPRTEGEATQGLAQSNRTQVGRTF